MIKVFSFVASCAGENSGTARYSDALAAALAVKAEAAGERINYERMTGAELRIGFCRSCRSCFINGTCPLDQVDDMAVLKQKLMESDVIFFGTPVYLTDISGMAKCVLDRLSYWAHRFELAGKLGVTFATTSYSFGQQTADHMKELLIHTGLTVVRSGYAVTTVGHPNLYIEQEMRPEMDAIADTIMAAWQDLGSFVTPVQEATFKSLNTANRKSRRLAELIGIQLWDENRVCEERGLADFPSYADLVAKMKGRTWDELVIDRSAGTEQTADEI